MQLKHYSNILNRNRKELVGKQTKQNKENEIHWFHSNVSFSSISTHCVILVMCHDQLENKLITVSYCYFQRRGFMLRWKTKEKVQKQKCSCREILTQRGVETTTRFCG